MYAYDEDRQVHAEGPGTFAGTVSDRWNVGPVPNGGYVLSLAMAALEREFPELDPLTITGHYLRPTSPGPFVARVETVKRGRNYSTASVSLMQEGKESLRVLATYGRLASEASGARFIDAAPHSIERRDCIGWNEAGGFAPEIARRFETLIAAEDAEVMRSGKGDRAQIRGWIRFADGRPLDAGCLGLIADAMPPPVFLVAERGWVPTIELTVHIRARPVSEWLRCVFRTRFVFGGLLEEDGEIWDEAGNPVALSRQLAGFPRRT